MKNINLINSTSNLWSCDSFVAAAIGIEAAILFNHLYNIHSFNVCNFPNAMHDPYRMIKVNVQSIGNFFCGMFTDEEISSYIKKMVDHNFINAHVIDSDIHYYVNSFPFREQ